MENRPSYGKNLTLGFGLVNVPISLKPLMETKARTGGHYLCATHMARVKTRYECPEGHLLAEGERVIGYPVPGTEDQYVVLDASVVDALAAERTGVAKIETVCDFASIDPLYLGQPYLCYPQKGAGEGFDLIRELLATSGKALVTRAVLSKETVQLVFRYSSELDVIIAHVCTFAERIRRHDVRLVHELARKPDQQMLKIAGSLMASLEGTFDPQAVEDTYSAALDEAIAAAAAGTPITVTKARPAASTVDLMEALKASLASAAEVKKPAKRRKKVAA